MAWQWRRLRDPLALCAVCVVLPQVHCLVYLVVSVPLLEPKWLPGGPSFCAYAGVPSAQAIGFWPVERCDGSGVARRGRQLLEWRGRVEASGQSEMSLVGSFVRSFVRCLFFVMCFSGCAFGLWKFGFSFSLLRCWWNDAECIPQIDGSLSAHQTIGAPVFRISFVCRFHIIYYINAICG